MSGLQKIHRAVLSGTWKGKTVNPCVTCYCFEGGNPGRWKNSYKHTHNCPYNTTTVVKKLVLNKIWTCSCHMQLISIHKNIEVSNVFKQIYKIIQSLTHMTCMQNKRAVIKSAPLGLTWFLKCHSHFSIACNSTGFLSFNFVQNHLVQFVDWVQQFYYQFYYFSVISFKEVV